MSYRDETFTVPATECHLPADINEKLARVPQAIGIDPSVVPPCHYVNEPEPGEPRAEELRKWSVEWLGLRYWIERGILKALLNTPDDGCRETPWKPDQRIEQAWLLVEKMLAEGMIFEISSHDSELSDWGVFFFRGGKMLGFGAEATAPLSILKAAYRAAQGKETP